MHDCADTRILTAVEHLAPEACGAFVVDAGQRRVGSVLVERNQICWAFTPDLRCRLRALLREGLEASASDLDPERLGSERDLFARSIADRDVMRAAIREHTIESLLVLHTHAGEQIEWVPHRADGYHAPFMFAPDELHVGVNARRLRIDAAAAEAGLALLGPDIPAATYARDFEGEPVAVQLTGPRTSLSDLVDLGFWVHAALGAVPGFSKDVIQRLVATADGDVAVGWRTSPSFLHAAVISSRAALGHLVGQLAARDYPTVLSRRASRPSDSPAARDDPGPARPFAQRSPNPNHKD